MFSSVLCAYLYYVQFAYGNLCANVPINIAPKKTTIIHDMQSVLIHFCVYMYILVYNNTIPIAYFQYLRYVC